MSEYRPTRSKFRLYRAADAGPLVAITLAYALSARATIELFSGTVNIFPVWPPAGVGLGLLAVFGTRFWPAISIGNLIANISAGASVPVALVFAVADTIEPLIPLWFLGEVNRAEAYKLEYPDDYLWLSLGTLLSSLTIAALGSTGMLLVVGLSPAEFSSNFFHWWVASAVGTLLFAPTIIIWRVKPRNLFNTIPRAIETVLFVVVPFLFGRAIFFDWLSDDIGRFAQGYWVVVILLWAATRYRRHGVQFISTMFAVQALMGAVRGTGVFRDDLNETGLVNMPLALLTVSASAILTALIINRLRYAQATQMRSLTEKIESDRALERSHTLLVEAQHLGKVGVLEADVPRGIAYWSAELCDLFGIPFDPGLKTFEEAATLIFDRVHPDYRDTVRDFFRRIAAKTYVSEAFDLHLLLMDGSERWLRRETKVTEYEDGRPIHYIATYQDVTDRKNVEIALKENVISTQRISRALAILAETNELVWSVKGISELFEGVCSLIVRTGGYAIATVGSVEQDGDKRVVPLAIAAVRPELESYARTANITWDETEQGLGPAGRAIRSGRAVVVNDFETDEFFGPWLEQARAFNLRSSLSCPMTDDGKPIYLLGIYSHDVDAFSAEESKLLERLAANLTYAVQSIRARDARDRAEERRAEILAALDVARSAVIISNEKFLVMYTNETAIDIMGLPADPAALQGRRLREFQAGNADYERAAADAISTVGETGYWDGIVPWRRPVDGKLIYLDTHRQRLPNGGYVSVYSDATRRIHQEQEALLRVELEAQQSKMSALGQLAGGVAHDFNNLLGAIAGFARFIVQDTPATQPIHGFAEKIELAVQRGKTLVQQILTFSRQSTTEYVSLDIGDVVTETLDLLTATLPSTTRLQFTPPERTYQVFSDSGQLSQVLVNLCVNASDALDGKSGQIAISVGSLDSSRPELLRLPRLVTKPSPMSVNIWAAGDHGGSYLFTGAVPQGDCVVLKVEDTGAGIAADLMEWLFTPFFTTKRKGRGTGLGLAVVHSIVCGQGGGILVHSVEGEGTSIEIMLEESSHKVQSPAATSIPVDAGAGPAEDQGRAATILIVDDNVDFCSMLETGLARLGHHVVSTNDPRDALAAIAQDPGQWDLVVTDQVMPEMSGRDLIRKIKAIRPEIHCVVCTGYSTDFGEAEAKQVGADALLNKPLDLDALSALIQALLDDTPGKKAAQNP